MEEQPTSPNLSAYVFDHSASVLRNHQWRTPSNSASYVLPHLKPDTIILDVGCGPGTITTGFAQLVPQGRVVGLDCVSHPLIYGRKLAQDLGLSNLEFCLGDVHSLPFADASFDVVHAHQVLQHVADPIRALREMRRVAKPGGLVAVSETASITWYPHIDGIQKWWDLQNRVARARGANPHPGSFLHTWANEAGFGHNQVRCTTGSWCFQTPEERAIWGTSMAERTQDSTFSRIVLENKFCTAQDLTDLAQAWRDWANNDNAWLGLLHGQIICHV
ncbi:class I SAM-dependent methyltransferase [Aspergillus tanneri]|uniref:Methyltransferase domain-containing protein n=1 Tax=Aspergillus tanneri TaxID=1220188 RepID=A0A5M9MSX3_9EURO|nr:uncharacterized protein ATNIH1004_002846 [Aspergillus tanneri]KAA8650165.1 hypothetical protein ATNIH1004_002846 [Aspergillus tanneri]